MKFPSLSIKPGYHSKNNDTIMPGLYTFKAPMHLSEDRIHLRLDRDGSGTMFINANQVFFLNQIAAFMTYCYFAGEKEEKVINNLLTKYNVTKATAIVDYKEMKSQLMDLIDSGNRCPIHDFNFDIYAPFSQIPSAPYRMDIALTYRCNNNCAHCYNARSRTFPELSAKQWKYVIDNIIEIGIPHIVFTGGEPTLYSDLRDLIQYAANKKLVVGLNTNGRKLSDARYVGSLRDAGLNHVQITVESHNPSTHERIVHAPGSWNETITGIQNAIINDLYLMTNTTLLIDNIYDTLPLLHFLCELGVKTIGINSLIRSGKGIDIAQAPTEDSIKEQLLIASSFTKSSGQRLIWYTPTKYCSLDPMELDLGIKGCTAALYNMCIEPDGSVLPCQSYYHSVGNILTDTWDQIWKHDLCISLRERKYLPPECLSCSLVSECGCGCPLIIEFENAH